ncbi:winged helix DNA-binding protein [Streptomyces sp. ISL-10]|uniref:MarR family winged helix-turn-helix transcriptional regulator n=1 Tax=Streptomyces sp. ISL-10 TaxID=2819172 RepID=UPI001BEC8680|nr:MarR family winged helix-turn-helix transcriptional regulator [Streptomyces sp. ISL-10]MBT2370213.1 winged helix DNA-binding protein [Streptomyces sp. ISL-10]
MEQPVFSGTAHDPSGAKFAFIGLSNLPTDWAQVLRAMADADLTIESVTPEGADVAGAAVHTAPAPDDKNNESGPSAISTTSPSVLRLNAYLMYAIGKAARRRLSEKLTARGLRLWHLTVLALLADIGPQSKGTLASRLDMNQSDLVKIVNDLTKAQHVDCVRDTADRRRVVVRLTPEGRAALNRLNADIASTDDDLLSPLTEAERAQLGSLLRRVHQHLALAPVQRRP